MGGPENNSELAPQVRGAGQKAQRVPGPSMPQPLSWPRPHSPHDHPTLTYYLNFHSGDQLLLLQSLQTLTLQDMLLTIPLRSQTNLYGRVWALLTYPEPLSSALQEYP